MEKHDESFAKPQYFDKLFEVPSNVLFDLFPAYTEELELITIVTADKFSHFYPFISPLACKHKCKALREKDAKVNVSNFQNKLLNIWLLTSFYDSMRIGMI